MYEAFLVIIAAAILGVCIGLVTATLVTAQFYLFLELPLVIKPPWMLVGVTLTVSIVTTFFAVLLPVKEVNNRRIASVLKSSA